MMRGIIGIVNLVCLVLAIAPELPLLAPEDEKVLVPVLDWWARKVPGDGTHFVISPFTQDRYFASGGGPAATTKLKDHILKEIKIEGISLGALVDQFIERNKKQARIKLAPELRGRFSVDEIDAFPKYFQDGGGGWKKWHEDNPKARGHCAVSLPVMDANRELVMIYVELTAGERVGKGTVFLFKREAGKVRLLGFTHVWIT